MHNGTRLVTDQRFVDFSDIAMPRAFAVAFARRVAMARPGSTAITVVTFKMDDRDAARMGVDCTRNPETAKPPSDRFSMRRTSSGRASAATWLRAAKGC